MEITKDNSYEKRIFIIMIPLMLVLLISSLDQTIVATAMPIIGKSLGDIRYLSWLATAYLLTSSISTLLFGKFGDMYGRKKIFLISIIIFLVGSFLCGMATSMTMLIIFRGFQGIGGGALNTLVMAIIGDIVPPLKRSKYQGYTSIIVTLALVAGPFLGGFISQYFSWRIIFYINIPIGILAVIIVALKVKLPLPTIKEKVDVLGGILATITTTLILLIVSLGGGTYPWFSKTILTLIALTIISLIGYIFVETKAKEPITPLHLFKSKIFVISNIQFLLSTLVLFSIMLYIPMFLQRVSAYSATKAGLFLIPMFIGLTFSAALSGQLIAKTGKYKIYPIIGSILTGLSMFYLSTINQNTSAVELCIPLFFAGAGIGFLIQVAMLAGQNAVDYKFLGVATGVLNFFKSIGGSFGAALCGIILTDSLIKSSVFINVVHSFDKVFFYTIPFMILSLILALIMKEKPLSDEMVKIADGSVEAPEY